MSPRRCRRHHSRRAPAPAGQLCAYGGGGVREGGRGDACPILTGALREGSKAREGVTARARGTDWEWGSCRHPVDLGALLGFSWRFTPHLAESRGCHTAECARGGCAGGGVSAESLESQSIRVETPGPFPLAARSLAVGLRFPVENACPSAVPLPSLLVCPAEQQEGEQGRAPVPLVRGAAHRAAGLPDRLPRAGARHGPHGGEHSAAAARGPALPRLLRPRGHWADACPCGWHGGVRPESRLTEHFPRKKKPTRAGPAGSLPPEVARPTAPPPHTAGLGGRGCSFDKKHFMYLNFYYEVSIKQAL